MTNIIGRQKVVLELLGAMRGRYAMLYVYAGITAALETVSVGLILPLIQVITQKEALVAVPLFLANILSKISELTLLQLSGLLFIVFATKGLLKLFAHYGNSKIVEEIRGEWMGTLFDKYVNQNYLFFVTNKHGVLMYNMFDLCQRAMFGLRQLVGLFLHGASLVMTLVFLTMLSWQLTVISILILVVGYTIVHRPMLAHSNILGKSVLNAYHSSSALASEVLRGIRDVKAYGAAVDLSKKYHSRIYEMVRSTVKIALLEVVPTVLPEIFLALFFFIAIAILERIYSAEGINTLLPLIGTFTFGLYRVFVQGSTVAKTGVAYTSHWPALDKLAQELRHPGAEEKEIGKISVVESQDTLMCKNISFAYEGKKVLNDISVEFRRGTITSIVGDSGAGKSTLTDLLIRLLNPTEGEIFYGKHNINNFSLKAWRSAVALVSQDVFLFHGTVRENLTIGMSDPVSDEQIYEALRLAGAEAFVDKLENGLDTTVGERGIKLSGGQRQRIAIARALVRKPFILLLDEATSALDVQTEAALLKTLKTLKEKFMIITVTHRLTVAQNSDHIYMLQNGTVVESGSHAELTKSKGEYWNLYERTDTIIS